MAQIHEYRMKRTGETFTLKPGETPPPTSIYLGIGEDETPPKLTQQEIYSILTASIHYDKQLFF